MAKIDKLLKLINSPNVAEMLDDDHRTEIAKNVVIGYEIDNDSRQAWLDTNKEAVKIIKHAENTGDTNIEKNFPFDKASQVVYPLISPAIIQLASRLIQHVVRNDRVADCTVLGKDQPQTDPITGQATGLGIKEAKADRVSKFLSYEMLVDSDTWLEDEHKLNHIVAGWGIGFKEVYYDPITKKNCSELLPPEDVIINNNLTSLDKARRITIRKYFSKNDIIEQIRVGKFLDIDLTLLQSENMDNPEMENDSREINPVYEVVKQYCFMDLDGDGYEEPWCVYVQLQKQILLGIYPAFEVQDISLEPAKGIILGIKPRFNIVDRHGISDPEGKFYSLGLNHLLLHQNKSLIAILRQLIDAGILANTAASSGFVTKAFKTKTRNIKVKLGEFVPLDTPLQTRIQDNVMNMPFREPSQVLLGLFELLIQSGKDNAFMSDVLAGDTAMQNVPATTMLAMVEQATRSFKPLVQKLYQSLKKEFKIWFHLHSKYLDQERYIKFQGEDVTITKDDFDEKNIDIVPVADPTMSSEAHKYARVQALFQLFQAVPNAINMQEALRIYLTELEFANPNLLIAPPPPPQPNPDLIKIQAQAQKDQQQLQLTAQKNQDQHVISLLKEQNSQQKLEIERLKTLAQLHDSVVSAKQQNAATAKLSADAHAEAMHILNEQKQINIEAYNAQTERQRVSAMEKQARNPNNSKGNSGGNTNN